jgi:hypothetical protein
MDRGRAPSREDADQGGRARAKRRRAAQRTRRGGVPAATAGKKTGFQIPQAAFLSRHPQAAGVVLIALFAAFLHSQLIPLVADADSFYHLRHAWVYRTHGIFDSSFPWAQYSVIRTYGADLWYGFHVLTIPLTLFDPLLDGIYWGGFLVTVASLWLVFATFRRLRVRWPLFWVFFFALMSSDLMYRLTMFRPHPLTLGFVLLLFAFLVTERSRGSLAAIALIAAALAWLHIALIWLPVAIAGIVSLVRLLHGRLPEWAKLGSLLAGLTVGIFLRPNPIGALHLAYIQVVRLMLEKHGDLPLRFGIELLPFYWINFADQFVPLSVVLLLVTVVFAGLLFGRRSPAIAADSRIAMWASLGIAVAFFVMTFTVARRSHEVFVGFSSIFVSLVACHWRPDRERSVAAKLVIAVAVLALVAAPIRSLYRFGVIASASFSPSKFRAVGEWLAQHAKPGDIVFNAQWDRFGELFFWDPQNFYINGMDPIFAYAYDPSLYWKAHYWHIDAADEATCGTHPCIDQAVIGTYESLKRDFHAAYIVVEPNRNPNLNRYLSGAPQFTKVLESDTQVVLYRID